jgi:prepilin-type N-terminal cleavage/methylation domain-containing protein/prepilin-type processing-associated H-X9-DG protein
MRKGSTYGFTKGFTLIELLVVIAIIAILAAILFPVFARAREKARQTQCLSNTKQLNLAFQQYFTDYDERIPLYEFGSHNYYWGMAIYPYVNNLPVYACPSRRDTPHIYYDTTHGNPDLRRGVTPRSYGFNSALSNDKLAEHEEVASIYLFHESHNQYAYYPSACGTVEEYADRLSYDNGQNEAPHNGGANFAYLDGHCKWQSAQAAFALGNDPYTR